MIYMRRETPAGRKGITVMEELVRRVPRWLPWTVLTVVSLLLVADLAIWAGRDLQEGLPMAGVALNVILRFVPIVLLLLALGLMIEVVEEEAHEGRMTQRARQMLFWGPRVSVLLFAGFVGLFALDVFVEGYSLGEVLLAFLIHLIPVFLLLGALAIAWRWEWVGAAMMMGWALFYIWSADGFPLSVYVYMAGLPLVLGLLFLLNWHYRHEIHGQPGQATT
jgi:hypothetical protein